jgi:hypothetical protein
MHLASLRLLLPAAVRTGSLEATHQRVLHASRSPENSTRCWWLFACAGSWSRLVSDADCRLNKPPADLWGCARRQLEQAGALTAAEEAHVRAQAEAAAAESAAALRAAEASRASAEARAAQLQAQVGQLEGQLAQLRVHAAAPGARGFSPRLMNLLA